MKSLGRQALKFDHAEESKLRKRLHQLERWLARECPRCEDEQLHLTKGTAERAYWHYGYLVAVRDMLGLIKKKESPLH
jgi:hypothetical protein